MTINSFLFLYTCSEGFYLLNFQNFNIKNSKYGVWGICWTIVADKILHTSSYCCSNSCWGKWFWSLDALTLSRRHLSWWLVRTPEVTSAAIGTPTLHRATPLHGQPQQMVEESWFWSTQRHSMINMKYNHEYLHSC